MSRFQADHFIEILRNKKRLSPHNIRRAVAIRCTYLVEKFEERRNKGEPIGFLEDELKALVQLAEAFDQLYPITHHHDEIS